MGDKCGQCRRITETHAQGCSHPDCPHRRAQAWCGTEGSQGFPGQLAEERIVLRRNERDRAIAVGLADL